MKTIVCATNPSLLEDLKVKIISVMSGIIVNQLENFFCKPQNHNIELLMIEDI